MVLRSETRGNSRKEVYYSDFATNLDIHPESGLLIRRTNERSINQALKALILTDVGERPFQPDVGGNIRASLFEPIDNFTANDLKDAISLTIYNNEPRVKSSRVSVVARPTENQYDVTIEYSVHNVSETYTAELVLKRLR